MLRLKAVEDNRHWSLYSNQFVQISQSYGGLVLALTSYIGYLELSNWTTLIWISKRMPDLSDKYQLAWKWDQAGYPDD